MRLGERGHEVPVVAIGDELFDARGLAEDYTPEFFASGGLDRLRTAVTAHALPLWSGGSGGSGGEQRVGAPVHRPGAVICVGQNYAAHAAESGAPTPEVPIIFFKHPNTIVGPDDTVAIPRGYRSGQPAAKVDWEVELAFVIGTEARYLESPEQALAHVAGYMVSNDVSERDFQLEYSGGQWSKGKCCADFNPLGPALIVDEITDPQQLGLRSWVNGEIRQDSRTADMVFSVADIVYHLSQFMTLSPGDVVNTGTPQGVALSGRFPYLQAGDVMETEIDGLGRQRQQLVSA